MDLVLDLKNHSNRILLKDVTNALGNHTRLTILDVIGGDITGNLNYGGIAEKIGKSPTSVTNHMGWLRRSDLIEDMVVEGKRGKMQKIPRLKYDKIIIKLT